MKKILLAHGGVALVDDADFEKVSGSAWFVSKGYATRHIPGSGHKGKHESMHRLLFPGQFELHHMDGNKCNNQRANLRSVTKVQNAQGFQNKKAGSSSIFRGVSWSPTIKRWRSRIKLNGREIYLGVFKLENDAARAYDAAARKYFGEFATPNFL